MAKKGFLDRITPQTMKTLCQAVEYSTKPTPKPGQKPAPGPAPRA